MKGLFGGKSWKNQRVMNMDSMILKSCLIEREKVLLSVVCDGVGSMKDGSYASVMAVKLLGEWLDEIDDVSRIGIRMMERILEINCKICEESLQKELHTASTLSALLIVRESYYIVHIGDSRIYAYEAGELKLLTHDDVSSDGRLTEYIGKSTASLHYMEGDVKVKTFMLCSDGLYKKMDELFLVEKIKKLTSKNIDNTMEELAQHVINQGEQDNISIAFVKK